MNTPPKSTWIAVSMTLSMAFCSFLLAGCQQPFSAMPEALDALVSDAAVSVAEVTVDDWDAPQNAYWTFTPNDVTPDTGFIIYPGGLVDPLAYAPTARGIAERGYFVAIVSMPQDLAIIGSGRGEVVLDAFPDITYWAVGGHSVGGTAASGFAKAEDAINGVVFWASYPSALYRIDSAILQAVSIYGTNDGLTTFKAISDSEPHLPRDAVYIEIEGANHTNFGWYGDGVELQRGDNPADLSRAGQQGIIIGATADFLATLTPPAVSALNARWCYEAQRSLESYTGTELPNALMTNTVHHPMNAFIDAKPAVKGGVVNIHTYVAEGLESSMGYQQIWCKLKTAEAIGDRSGGGSGGDGESQACAVMNQAAIDYALLNVAPGVRAAYETAGVSIDYLPDLEQGRGDQWVDSSFIVTQNGSNSYSMESSRLRTSKLIPFVGGMNYCKLLSPEAALQFVKDVSQ